jgi:uncharacterized membrane protein
MSAAHRSEDSIRADDSSPQLAGVVGKNIAEIVKIRAEEEHKKGLQERLADLLTRFSGSMAFVYVHAIWFGVWIALNIGWVGIKPFDPFPFSLLTLVVSLEAIFLSTFVLISQNHAGTIADKRADLDLQINLLSEHEITSLLRLMDAVARHLGVDVERHDHQELMKNVAARKVLDEIESHSHAEKSASRKPRARSRRSPTQ